MGKVRSTSDPDPLSRPDLANKATYTAIRAAAMGLIPPGTLPERMDSASLGALLGSAQRAGIVRGRVREAAASYTAGEVEALLDELQEALAESPVPETEWPALDEVFESEQLAALVGISVSSLRRYAAGTRRTPDKVAARLHFLALVVGDLSGSYNEVGVRRWFERKRTQLDGQAPAELLQGDWDPNDAGPLRVRSLAAALLASPAT